MTAEGPVESWLAKVEQAMRDALYDNAKRAVNEYPRAREDSIRRDKWLWDYPAQVNKPYQRSFCALETLMLLIFVCKPERVVDHSFPVVTTASGSDLVFFISAVWNVVLQCTQQSSSQQRVVESKTRLSHRTSSSSRRSALLSLKLCKSC